MSRRRTGMDDDAAFRRKPTVEEQIEGLGLFAPPPIEQPPTFDECEDDYVAPVTRLGETFDADADARRLASNTTRVLRLLLDGREHTVEELRDVGGAQGERRLRELRDKRFGELQVTARRADGGLWYYRLTAATDDQLRLAERTLKVRSGTFRWRGGNA